jgi:hypothetical protein
MHRELLKARGERTALLQPAQTALDHIAITLAYAIIADWPPAPPFATLAARRDYRPDAVPAQPVPDTLRVVGPVSANPARASPWWPAASLNLHRLDQRFELRGFVSRAWQQQCTERHSVAINQEVQFRAKAAA